MVAVKADARHMMNRRAACVLGWLAMLLPAAPCGASPTVIKLLPGSTRIDLTIYAMGLFPLPAHFGRFNGTLSLDPGAPAGCVVALQIEAASLQMADPARTALAIGPRLLDAPHYPWLRYAGSCANGQATGALTLHGVTRPLGLVATRSGDEVEAAGTVRRQDFGVDGLPGLIGRTIGIRFTVALPHGLAARIAP